MISTKLLFFYFLFIFSSAFAIDFPKDSAKTIKDSTEVKNLLSLSKKYKYTNNDLARNYANQASVLAREINFIKGEIKSNYELGAISILLGQNNSSNTYFKNGLKLSKKIDNKFLIASGYFNLSRYNLEAKNYSKSIDYINDAILIFNELKNEIEISNSYSLLGNIYKDLSNYEKSLNYYFKALKIQETFDNKKNIATLYINIGRIYLRTVKYDDAFSYFNKSLELNTKINNEEGIAKSIIRIGVAHQKKSEYDKAILYYKKALPLTQNLNLKKEEAIVLQNLGSTLREFDKYQESLNYLFRALKIQSDQNEYSDAAHTCNDISETYLELKKIEEAKKYALKAIDFSTNVNMNQQKYAYYLLSTCQYQLGNYKSSYQSLSYSNTLRDSIFSIEKEVSMNELDVKYQTEKKEYEILKLKEEKQGEILKRNNYIIGGLTISFILFILFNRQRIRTAKNKNLLQHEKELTKIRSRFFNNISHEFRTPLTLILGPIDEIIQKVEQPDNKNKLIVIKRNAKMLLNLVNQLLDLSKIESGKLKLNNSKSDIIQVIKGISMSFQTRAKSKNIQLRLEVNLERVYMSYDRKKFESILTNLLSNAFKFTPDFGKILISIKLVNKQEREFVSIIVSDSGIGIPKEDVEHIFNRFYQSETNQLLQQEGSGIGLALLKELVELHEGTVQVKSEVGIGTKIIVEIPTDLPIDKTVVLTETIYENQLEKEGELYDIVEQSGSLKNKKPIILLVEDHKDIRNYINEILKNKFRIVNAKDGEEGISKGLKLIPDLIVSDVMMPKKNGIEVCSTFKKDERTSHIPVILLTAKSSTTDKIEGLSTRADDYITKPFNPEELKVRIDNLIELRKKLKVKYKRDGLLKPKEVTVNTLDENFLNKLIELVELNLGDEKFGVEQLSIQIGLSRSQLHRKLTALLGQGPSEFIRVYRLQRAHELLKQKSGSISEISYQVGFGSPSYFSKCYLKLFGHSPKETSSMT